MWFGVLGPVEARRDERPIALGGPRQRAVLAHLIVRANQVVPIETLIDLVWDDDPPPAARNSLQSYISHLRKALGSERLEGRPPGYVLHASPDEIDASTFEALLAEADGGDGDADRMAAVLREALGLWRGPAFADLAGEPALAAEITRLEDLRLRALERRVDADLEAGRHGEVIGELEVLTREHPLRERPWASLMLALYRSGRQADALAAFGRARELLAEELGVDPSAELRTLHERILRQDPALEIRGQPLRGYRLLEQVGEGTFGVVHRAIQSHVGREVAVKTIHPELANRPDFVRRFDHEAQVVARLEHPHVVPLYDYWRDPGGAYLVMRFLRGGSLEALLDGRGLDPGPSAAILDQVAGALAAAHRQGVVHRDVKSGNVLLDEDGNAYLSDFGVALESGAPAPNLASQRGTPAYLSPEQIRSEPATPASDVYSLGVLLYEMLAGEPPFAGATLDELLNRVLHQPLPAVTRVRPELPVAVDRMIERATAKDPARRFGDPRELATAFRAAIEATEVSVVVDRAVRNPYKGLRAFAEADADDFFGRESVVRRLVQRLAERGERRRFLCVVGPSGSGKSSLVRAGLVPALRAGALAGSDRWFFVDLVPGRHPLRELESALLGVAVRPPPSLLEDLERDELGLVRAVDRILPDPEAELVIVLDQLEELFTLADEGERGPVLDLVRAAAETPGSRLRVVATLRADLFDQPLSVPGFGDLLADRIEPIPPMSADQLERAVTAPAERAGLRIEPGLVAEIVADVADRPGALPLLQYALTELVDRRDGEFLTVGSYEQIGGVSGAVARRAEQLFEPLHAPGQEACRQLFLRLVAVGEGGEVTRRRVRRSELLSLADGGVMDAVVETFGRHRLLSFDRDPATREPTVEIAHEAILGAWDRLADWIDASREELRVHARLAAAASEWVRSGRDSEDLLTGGRLVQIEEAAGGASVALSETELEYLVASVARRDAERDAEHARHEREVRLERRSVRRLRAFVAALTAASLVAAALTVVAVNGSREAERRRDEATVLGLTGAVLTNLDADPALSLRLALHAVDLSASIGQPVPAATVEALHWAIQESRVEYPVADAPVVALAGPQGYRGVFDLPVSDLANLGLEHSDRSLDDDACEPFFGTSTCPALPDRFPPGIPSAPPRTRASGAPLSGTTVTILGFGDEGIFRELARLSAASGIDIAAAEGELVTVLSGDGPDIVFPQPGLLADLARQGRLMDLGVYLNIDQLRDEFTPYLLSLGTVAADGSWPADDGTVYGAPVSLNLKSLVWYPVPEFRRSGYEIPSSWEELVDLTARMVAEGRTPWCLGLESGTADGWIATDWVENLLLGSAGPRVYDRWTTHQIGFDHPAVRRAMEHFGRIVHHDENLFLGTGGALVTSFESAQIPMVSGTPPQCWLYHFPSFAPAVLPRGAAGRVTDAFRFPPVSSRHGDTLLGGGQHAVALSDRPEVREVMRFLLSPDFGRDWFTSGEGALSANRRFDMSRYAPFWRRKAELLHDALRAGTFRFDASDLMPEEVGLSAFWGAMMRYISEGPDSLDEILAELDAAWPDG